MVTHMLEKNLGYLNIAKWNNPAGYFISLMSEGCAKQVAKAQLVLN